MWIVPMLSAALVTHFSVGFLILVLCFALLYVVHHPIVLTVRKSSSVDEHDMWRVVLVALPAVFLGLVLVVVFGRVWLLLFAVAEVGIFLSSVRAFVEKDQRSFRNELAVVAALTLSGPAAYYTITGSLGTEGVKLYILNLLFFGSSVFYVKTRIEFLRTKRARTGEAREALRMMLVYHLFLLTAIVAAVIAHLTSPWIILAFVPMLVQVAAGSISRETRMNFKRLGVGLVVQSAVFLSVLALFFR